MAVWDKITSSGNVQDRRGSGPMMVGGGLSLTGLVIVLLFNYLSGGNIGDVLNQIDTSPTSQVQSYNAQDFEGADNYEIFAGKVLGSANDMWVKKFTEIGKTYNPPKLVLFRGATQSSCGGADSRVGPHYCPYDKTIYLDETFFEELNRRLKTEGGDVAEAYVIAHEVGHHAQLELNLLNENSTNDESIKTELQADCFAGLWANSIRNLGVFEPGEIKEALDGASSVGDDRIQKTTTGRINPETWTHGSSAARVAAFTKGYETGQLSACGL